jgi:hypothetical protein
MSVISTAAGCCFGRTPHNGETQFRVSCVERPASLRAIAIAGCPQQPADDARSLAGGFMDNG